MILQAVLQFILQYLKVKVSIHPTINLNSIPNSFSCHASLNHDETSSKLDSSLYQPITQPHKAFFTPIYVHLTLGN
jgi:hypothetical protein